LTFSGGPYGSPTWSSDGQYIFAGTLSFGMYWMRADGSSQPQQLTQSTAIQLPTSFRPDGKTLAFVEIDLAGGHPPQIWTVSVENEGGQWKAGKPEQFLKSKSVDNYPRFSRDGRWLAYSSNETGTFEVYVRPFPLPASDKGGKWTISTGGGNFPAWSPVGNELMYQAGDQVMAATYSEKGETFVLEKRRVWIPKLGGVSGFVLSLDARRILVVAPAQAPEAPRQEHTIVFLRNFFDELRRRVPLPK
jgi:Tol biopolymer transport system component